MCHGYYFHLIDNKANHLLNIQHIDYHYQLLKISHMCDDIIHDTIEVLYIIIINIYILQFIFLINDK